MVITLYHQRATIPALAYGFSLAHDALLNMNYASIILNHRLDTGPMADIEFFDCGLEIIEFS